MGKQSGEQLLMELGWGGVTLTPPSCERCGWFAAPQCPVPSDPWDCCRLTQAETSPSPLRFLSHLWECPGIASHLWSDTGAGLWGTCSTSSASQVAAPATASIPQPMELQWIQGEDAASSPALAARRVEGSREGSGPSWVYTKLSGCCADAAQAWTNHPNQLHQHWEHNSQQMGNWV